MNVAQCDNCRNLGPTPPIGWVKAATIQPPAECSGNGWARYLGADRSDHTNHVVGIFCTWQCAAEYARARALLSDMDNDQAF